MPLKTILDVRRFRMKNLVTIWLKTSDEINVGTHNLALYSFTLNLRCVHEVWFYPL